MKASRSVRWSTTEPRRVAGLRPAAPREEPMERIEHRACSGGWQDVYRHHSATLGCDMQFAVYLPPQAATRKLPVLYWLSGLTCTEQNFITKAGAQRYAAEHGVILVAPDTSPRGEDVADAEGRSEEHTSELQSQSNLVCRLLLEKKKKKARRPQARNT